MNYLPGCAETIQDLFPRLGVRQIVALKPWFGQEILERACELLRDRQVMFFKFQRRFAVLQLKDGTRVFLKMGEGKGKHRFVFRDGSCNSCGWQQGGINCVHVAALALLCLKAKNDILVPHCDLFPESVWYEIGKFLHEQASPERRVTPELLEYGEGWVLQGASEKGLLLRVLLSAAAAAELRMLFPVVCGGMKAVGADSRCDAIFDSIDELKNLAAGKTESVLNENGLLSKRQKLEMSLWGYLSQQLFLHLPVDSVNICRNEEQLYSMQTSEELPLFQLILPRDQTWGLLGKVSCPGVPVSIEKGEPFSRVFFAPDRTAIEVEHCCRMENGMEYTLRDLENRRFGNRYQVDGVFYAVQQVPPDERLTKREKGQLALFASKGKAAVNEEFGFSIEEQEIAEFVENNHAKLHCGRHDVADEILHMQIVTMPQELLIDSFEEDGEWCYLAGWYGMGSREISLPDLLEAAENGRRLLPGKTWLNLEDSPLSWFHKQGRNRIRGRDGFVRMKRGEFLALGTLIGTVVSRKQRQLKSLAGFLQTGRSVKIPDCSTAAHLRSYQHLGCSWLYQLQQYQLGGILADDMGLGKTHQALALIDLLAEPKSRFLIVCPAAVLYHWPEKQERFFPGLHMSVYHGAGRDLEKSLEDQIVVTSYGVMRQDIEQFANHTFKLLLFDEMHVLKNRKTAIHGVVERLHAETIIGLTGTPVENHVGELEALLSICLPGIFSAAPVRRRFQNVTSREQRQQLQRLVAPFILRRTRDQVLKELPQCSEDIRLCELSSDQVGVYRQATEQVLSMVEQSPEEDTGLDYAGILATITRLKQICNHLCQLEHCTEYDRFKSGKWDEFTRLAEQCLESGLKVVVFSQFTAMLDIIETWLADRDIHFISLRGSVSAKERATRIGQFNTTETYRFCCASLLAGGTGIDLTGAQVVIHYDRWWNPAKEEQATARVHRMGQTRPVQVYKLVTAGTLEEKIHKLIEKKRGLAADLVVANDSSVLKKLKPEELAELFRL